MNLAELLQAIADAIREKKNSVESINAQNFPEEILELSIGDGNSVNYVKVIWNEDDTISFVDTDGITHLMDCKYEDDKITEVIYNNEKIDIDYKNDDLILINDTEIDLSKLKIENYIEQYTSITFKEDNTIELVDTDGVTHTMSYTYENDEEKKIISATFDESTTMIKYEGDNLKKIGSADISLKLDLANKLYGHFDISKEDFPYVAFVKTSTNMGMLHFFQKYSSSYIGSSDSSGYWYDYIDLSANEFPEYTDYEGVVGYIIKYVTSKPNVSMGATPISRSVIWSNVGIGWQPDVSTHYPIVPNIVDFQNGFALGMASGGVVEIEVPAKEEQEKTITITENGTTEIVPDENKALSKVTVVTDVSGGSDLAVEYIESTGTQYIDTGIIPTNHRVKMKFQCTTNDNACLLGSYGDKSNDSNYNVYELVWYGGRWYYAPNNTNGSQSSFSPTVYPTDIVELDFNTYDNKIVMNNTEVADTYGVSRAVLPLYLFVQNSVESYAKMKLWYAQIYDRDTQELVRDFIPALDENDVVCLYDKVTKTYFYNQGSGEFHASLIAGGLVEIETLIDSSGVLEDTEGTVTEKIEELIDKAKNGGSPSINGNGIVSFGGNTTIDENGIVSL